MPVDPRIEAAAFASGDPIRRLAQQEIDLERRVGGMLTGALASSLVLGAEGVKLDIIRGGAFTGSGLGVGTASAPWFNLTYTTGPHAMQGFVYGVGQFQNTVATWRYLLANFRCTQASLTFAPYDLRNAYGTIVGSHHANPSPWAYFELPARTVCNFEYMAQAEAAGAFIHQAVAANWIAGVFWRLS